jgi:hypothetical protein
MKKNILTAVTVVLLLSSCHKDDDDNEPTVAGTWKTTKQMSISGKDNSILYSENYNACEGQSNFVFTDNKATYSRHELDGNNCILGNSETFTYTYNSETKTLNFTNDQAITESYVLNELTQNEMQIIQSTYDNNNDGFDDKSVIVLNK